MATSKSKVPEDIVSRSTVLSAKKLAARLYSEDLNRVSSATNFRSEAIDDSKTKSSIKQKGLMMSSASAPALKVSEKSLSLTKKFNSKARESSQNVSKNLTATRSSLKKMETANVESDGGGTQVREVIHEKYQGSNSTSTADSVPKSFLDSLHLSEREMDDLLNTPNTFYYLCPVNKSDTKFYDLELVTQDKVDQNHYYTISKEGITQYRMKQSQFTTRAQWEREYSLFHRISTIRFFRQYRCWKVRLTDCTSTNPQYLIYVLIRLHSLFFCGSAVFVWEKYVSLRSCWLRSYFSSILR